MPVEKLLIWICESFLHLAGRPRQQRPPPTVIGRAGSRSWSSTTGSPRRPPPPSCTFPTNSAPRTDSMFYWDGIQCCCAIFSWINEYSHMSHLQNCTYLLRSKIKLQWGCVALRLTYSESEWNRVVICYNDLNSFSIIISSNNLTEQ